MVETINPDELEPHPRNHEIYGKIDEEDVTDLLTDIKENGFNEEKPIQIVEEPRDACDWPANRIVSGHRRCRAARTAGLDEVPIEYKTFDTGDEEERHLLRENQYRQKTDGQLIKEGYHHEQLIRDGDADVDGRVTDKVADRIGKGRKTYEKGRKVMEAAESGSWGEDTLTDEDRELATEQWQQLIDDEQSIHGAWSTVDAAISSDYDEEDGEAGKSAHVKDVVVNESPIENGDVGKFAQDDTVFPITSSFPTSYREVIEQAAADNDHEVLGDHVAEVYLNYLEEKYL